MKNKVSIIIPVYNAESTVEGCIKSVINQTYKDIEIILINDGSKDRSIDVLKKYEKIDRRIVVIDKENEGVSITRNSGVKIAKGSYIMFIDNDDYIDSDYVERFVNEIMNSNCDMVCGGYRRVTESEKILETKIPNNIGWGKFYIITPWAKIYKRDFILKSNIEFLNYGIGEDIYFYLQILDRTTKVRFIDYVGYNWFFNEESVSNTSHKGFNKKIDLLFLIKKIQEKIDGNGNINIEIRNYYFIRLIIWYLFYSGRKASKKDFIEQYNYLFEYLNKNIKNYGLIAFGKMPKGEIFGVKLLVRSFIILDKLHLVELFALIYCRGGKNEK